MAAPLPQLCEKREQTAQARLGDLNKRRADVEDHPLLGPQEVPTY